MTKQLALFDFIVMKALDIYICLEDINRLNYDKPIPPSVIQQIIFEAEDSLNKLPGAIASKNEDYYQPLIIKLEKLLIFFTRRPNSKMMADKISSALAQAKTALHIPTQADRDKLFNQSANIGSGIVGANKVTALDPNKFTSESDQ